MTRAPWWQPAKKLRRAARWTPSLARIYNFRLSGQKAREAKQRPEKQTMQLDELGSGLGGLRLGAGRMAHPAARGPEKQTMQLDELGSGLGGLRLGAALMPTP